VQEVSEFVSTWPEIADAKAARQRSAMQQDSADPWEFHAANIRWPQLPGQAQSGARSQPRILSAFVQVNLIEVDCRRAGCNDE
jgi:hypothetical protein